MGLIFLIIIVVSIFFILYSFINNEESTTPIEIVNHKNETISIEQPKKKSFKNDNNTLPEGFKLTEEFKEVFDKIENKNVSIFLTGKAGTGKSTFLKYFKKNTKKNYVVLAPTGIASLNVNGQTIHSFFRLAPKLITPDSLNKDPERVEILCKLNTIIIDEISMVRADLLDGINESLQKHRGSRLPFGGVQMVFIGDLFQLPPVIVGNDLQQYFKEFYNSGYFFSAKIIPSINLKIFELSEIFRQKNDPTFINILNSIRKGNYEVNQLETLNRRVVNDFKPKKDDAFINLCTTNKIADFENQNRLNLLNTDEFSYHSTITGDFNSKFFPTLEILKLKVGAQIMTLKNNSEKNFVNGSIGKIHKLEEDKIIVSINGKKHTIEKHTWERIEYQYDKKTKKIESKVVGTFEQYPLKLAWAITIHKSQGQTFEQIIIDLGRGAFAHGQTYVALSRCKSLNGIILDKPIRQSDIIVDKVVNEFMLKQDLDELIRLGNLS